jgi:hypothetical protein
VRIEGERIPWFHLRSKLQRLTRTFPAPVPPAIPIVTNGIVMIQYKLVAFNTARGVCRDAAMLHDVAANSLLLL